LLRQDGFSDLEQDNLDALSKRFGVTAIGVEASGLDHMIVVAIAARRSRSLCTSTSAAGFPP
jgi:hypothetical protein